MLFRSGSAGPAAVAMNRQGDGVAVWWHTPPGSGSTVRAAALDVTAPELRSPAVPLRGYVGEPVTMTAAAFDLWTARPAIGWLFGDAATAAGPRITHVFTRPGQWSVAVVAVDDAGHATAAARSIAIVRHWIRARVRARWEVRRRVSRLVSLRVARVPDGAVVRLRCLGRRCARPRALAVRGRLAVLHRSLRYRAGQKLRVEVRRSGWTPRTVTYRLRRGRRPLRRTYAR